MSCILGMGKVVDIEYLITKHGFDSIDELYVEFEEVGLAIIIHKNLAFVAFDQSIQTFEEQNYFIINTSYEPSEEDLQMMLEYVGKNPQWIVFALETEFSTMKESLDQITKSIAF